MEVMMPIWGRIGSFMPATLRDEDKAWKVVKDNPLNEKFRYYCCTYLPSCRVLHLSCCIVCMVVRVHSVTIEFLDDAGYLREKHFDGCFLRSNNGGLKRDQSHYTVLIYLNEGFDGGLSFC